MGERTFPAGVPKHSQTVDRIDVPVYTRAGIFPSRIDIVSPDCGEHEYVKIIEVRAALRRIHGGAHGEVMWDLVQDLIALADHRRDV